MPWPFGTGAAWLSRLAGSPPPAVDLAAAGQLALAEARRLFALDIWDPPASDHRPVAERWRDEITACVAGDQGLGWTWEGRYTGDGAVEWCGAFAARCWARAGLPLAIRKRSWSSCLRLQRWASCRPSPVDGKPEPRVPGRLCVDPAIAIPSGGATVQPGDVLIVGEPGYTAGRHITIVESFDGRVFHTISGNGVGLGPDDRQRQGVVRRDYAIGGHGAHAYGPRWLIRPAASDLAQRSA